MRGVTTAVDAAPTKSKAAAQSSSMVQFMVSGALLALTWCVFGQTLRHDFVNFDDYNYVAANPAIRQGITGESLLWVLTHTVSSNWHPVTMLSHLLDVQLFGLNASGHHLASVLLHSGTVLLLFAFLNRATHTVWRSAFVAALFAIHPLRVESVAWIAERKDVLSGLFFLLTLHLYLNYVRRPSTGRLAWTTAVYACGLMSKPILVTVPLVLLLLDFWPLRRRLSLGELVSEKLPLLVLALTASLVTLVTQAKAISSLESLTLSERIANAGRGTFTYIGQMVYPVKLAPFYPLPADAPRIATTVLFVALLLSMTAGAFLVRRRWPYVTVGWLWYVVMLVPVSGLIQTGAQAHADRYTYLPHIGLYVIAAWAAVDVFGRRRYARPILSTAAAVVILAAAAQAWRQARIWRDSEALWRHALAVTEPNYISHGSLARFLCSKGRVAEAVPHFEAALVIRPEDVASHKNVAAGLVQLGRPAEAIAHLEKALQIEPNDFHAQADLAWVCATSPESSLRDGARALRLAQSAIAGRGERTPSLLRTLSAAHAEIGEFAEAIEAAREASQLAKGLGQKDVVEELESEIRGYELARLVRNASHDRDDMEAD